MRKFGDTLLLVSVLFGITFAQCSYGEQYRCRSSLDRTKIYLSHAPCDRGMRESDGDVASDRDSIQPPTGISHAAKAEAARNALISIHNERRNLSARIAQDVKEIEQIGLRHQVNNQPSSGGYRCRNSLDRSKIYLSQAPCNRGMSESDLDLTSESDQAIVRDAATYSKAKKDVATTQCAQQAVGAYPFNRYSDTSFWYQSAHDTCSRITARYPNPTTRIRDAHDCAGRIMAARPASATSLDSPGTDYISAFRRCAN
jgi:hypothetical protein